VKDLLVKQLNKMRGRKSLKTLVRSVALVSVALLTCPGAWSDPIQLRVEKTSNTIRLSDSEQAELGRHDIVLLIDKSESMGVIDCPSVDQPGTMVSRWLWCEQQASDLARQTAAALPDGLTVVLFSNFPQPFPHVNAFVIPQIFARTRPGGMTNEAAAIELVLNQYYEHRKEAHGKVRPLMIAIITDGLPTNPFAVKRDLVEVAQQMKHEGEINFAFFQVGEDPQGIGFAGQLTQALAQEHAKFNIVSGRTFPEMLQTGLAKAMVDCLAEPRQ
jgi:uncharacterized protein YegL